MENLGISRDQRGRFVHPSAIIDDDAILEDGVTVWQFATIGNSRIMRNVVVGSNVWIGNNCQIHENTRIGHGSFLPHGTVVGAGVFIGPNVTMTDDRMPRAGSPYIAQPPTIEGGASIGAGAVILPGVRIGRFAMIAAGAVVTKDVLDGETVRGVPAKANWVEGASVKGGALQYVSLGP